MIIGRRYSAYIDPLTIARGDRVRRILRNLGRTEPIVYWDDIHAKIVEAFRANRLYPLNDGLLPLDPTDIATNDQVNINVQRIGDSLDYIFIAFAQLPGYLDILAQTVTSTLNDSSEKLKKVQDTLGEVEAAGKQRRNANSIKNEKRIIELFINDNNISSSTLDVDQANGTVTLKKISTVDIPYIINRIHIPKKRKLTIPQSVNKPIDDGYYFGEFYNSDPTFETRDASTRNDNDPNIVDSVLLKDKNFDTFFQTEFVTDRSDDELIVQIKIQLDKPQSINMISISTNNFGTSKWVQIDRILADDIDITDTILGNGIRLQGDLLVNPDNEIIPNKSDAFPRSNAYTQIKASRIEVHLRQPSFYKIRIPHLQKIALNGIILRKFNYLESFILRAIPARGKKFSPYILDYDKNDLASEYDSNHPIVPFNEIRNRYAIGVRELSLHQHKYTPKGLMITRQFNVPGDILSIEIYVDEIVPDNTTIKYKILLDNDTELELIPVNSNAAKGTKRYVFNSNFKLDANETLFSSVISNFRMQIEMTGTTGETAILRSMLLRIKVEE